MSTKQQEFNSPDDLVSGSEGSEYSDSDDGSLDSEQERLKQRMDKLKEKKEATSNAATSLSRNAQIEAKHHKTMKAFAPVWLIAPFVPFLESLITIFVGSVVIGVTNVSECTEALDIYAGGTVFISYLYVIVYGGAFIGVCGWKFTNMMSYKVVGSVVCVLGFIWHIVGQLLFSAAGACEELTPPLYSYTKFQLTMFWVTFAVYVACFARWLYMRKFADQRAARAARADRIRKLEEADRLLKKKAKEEEEALRAEEAAQEAEEEKRRVEQEEIDAKKRALAEQYGNSSDDESDEEHDNPLPGAPATPSAAAES